MQEQTAVNRQWPHTGRFESMKGRAQLPAALPIIAARGRPSERVVEPLGRVVLRYEVRARRLPD